MSSAFSIKMHSYVYTYILTLGANITYPILTNQIALSMGHNGSELSLAAKRVAQTQHPLGKASAFIEHQNCLGLSPQDFLGSTQHWPSPPAVRGLLIGYIPPKRDVHILYSHNAA